SVKAREKDNTTALPWDKIDPATYSLWQPTYNADSIVSKANARINLNPVFKAIQNTNTWMDANENRPISLNLKTYKADQAKIRKMFDRDDKGVELKEPLELTVLKPDYDTYFKNPDKTKADWYTKWKADVSKDVYIKETAKIVTDMISARKYLAASKPGQN
ncbi:MAG TPA: carboxy terminal-processing peptidase, partial [Arachidicoccus sp.]|nr:carboxy terminal-processing peptidase [Arachidicoccus sp.]